MICTAAAARWQAIWVLQLRVHLGGTGNVPSLVPASLICSITQPVPECTCLLIT